MIVSPYQSLLEWKGRISNLFSFGPLFTELVQDLRYLALEEIALILTVSVTVHLILRHTLSFSAFS